MRLAPSGRLKYADVGDVPMLSRFDLAQCHADIEACYRAIADTRAIPLSVGGDHSISGAILKGLAAKAPVGMVHIDAHCDTAGPYEGSKFHHGAPFREAVLAGVLDPERTIQIGMKGGLQCLLDFLDQSGMTVISMEDFAVSASWRGRAGGVCGHRRRAHDVTVDVDGFDPAYAPGTGTPEVGVLAPGKGWLSCGA